MDPHAMAHVTLYGLLFLGLVLLIIASFPKKPRS